MTLRAARWSRVSSAQQATEDRNGLPFQRTLQNEGIATLGATDTGIDWVVTNSGHSVHETAQYRDMIAQAGKTFDVLVVPMADRIGRNAEEQLRAIRLISEAGAFVYLVDEDLRSDRETSWEQIAAEIVGAEAWLRKHRRKMRRTYANRVEQHGIPGGNPPFGFVVNPAYDGTRPFDPTNRPWLHDPIKADIVRSIFHDYATDATISLRDLADRYGLAEEHVKEIARCPAYAGWASLKGDLRPGAMEPIIDRDLWNRVSAKRETRRSATGGPRPARPGLLRGLLHCTCGVRIRMDGMHARGYQRVVHPRPTCDAWGPHAHKRADLFTEPVKAAMRGIRYSEAEAQRIASETSKAVVPLPDTRPVREALARRFSRKEIDADTFLARARALDEQEAAYTPTPAPERTPEQVQWFWTFVRCFSDPQAEEEELAKVAKRIFERIEHVGPDALMFRTTPEADSYHLPYLMPDRVELARPEGFEPPTC